MLCPGPQLLPDQRSTDTARNTPSCCLASRPHTALSSSDTPEVRGGPGVLVGHHGSLVCRPGPAL